MNCKDLGFGIIGCGVISNWHANAISKIDGARLIGATDVYEPSRIAFAQKYNVKAFDSVEALLASPEVDIVCICTPSGLHAPLAIQAANAGKNVVVEKPMALTVKEADDIILACEKNKVKMAVMAQMRFSDAAVKLKDAVDRGLLGKLVSGDIYMKYYRSQEYYDKSGWRGTWKMDGGGALMNQGIHGVDLLRYIMGPVKSVFGHAKTLARNIEVEDTAAAVLEYENGAIGVIQGTTSVYPGLPRRLEINGDKGTIILEEGNIVKWDIEGQNAPDDIKIGGEIKSSSSNPTDFGIEGHTKQLTDMVNAIRENRKPMIDQYEGKKPVQLITAIYESSRTGRRIDF